MPTHTKENYLKAIYYLDNKDADITVSALAEVMSVSKPTVNNMVKKMTVKGWLHYKKYKPLIFSDKGRLAAAQIIRKHRLTEIFLVEVMGNNSGVLALNAATASGAEEVFMPERNEDMEMFKQLGLNPQKPFTKVSQPKTVEASESKLQPLGEKPKWSRPGHKIERNEEAKAKSKVVD